MRPMATPRLAPIALRSVALNFAWGIALGSIFFFTGGGETTRDWFGSVAVSTAYSNFIGLPGTIVFVLLSPRLRALRPMGQVLAYLAMLAPVAVIGCAAADAFFVAVRLRLPDGFLGRFAEDVRVTLIITVIVGAAVIGYERLRARLVDAEARLRDEELSRERALRLAADAQLSSLESRIRPHFLFNALNAVLALVPDDPKRAEAVLERITALLRASLRTAPGGLVPLRDELALVVDYLEIEAVRFESRLRWTIDVPDALQAIAVPAFSVQTVVENAVKYAASARREGASIRVSARSDQALVAVDVEDDGPGFDGQTLPDGHGLATLRARLSALFGDAGALEIAGNAGRARVTIRLPAKQVAA
jgi:two-component system, LytTR family, sensor histidine kinase AlgZ